jgi:hypothetical protein
LLLKKTFVKDKIYRGFIFDTFLTGVKIVVVLPQYEVSEANRERNCKRNWLDFTGSGLFLQVRHFAANPGFVPARAHLFGICRAGHQNTRAVQRVLAGNPTDSEMPPLGDARLRPCAAKRKNQGKKMNLSSLKSGNEN